MTDIMLLMSVSRIKIYPKDTKPFGLSFSDWSIKWWQWILTIPNNINPANDLTGIFLCQTIEQAAIKPSRKVSIRNGSCIFMPVLNWISNFYEHGKTENELIEIAKRRMDVIGNIEVTLDGLIVGELEQYSFLSGFFEAYLPEHNVLGLPPGQGRFISDGYWLFTCPIFNNAVITTFASCSSGATKIGVKYSITVF